MLSTCCRRKELPMTTHDVAVERALDTQEDLQSHREHCSVDPAALAAIGRTAGQQVRIWRGTDEYALYTVVEDGEPPPADVVQMGPAAQLRLDGAAAFAGLLDSQVPNPTLPDEQAPDHSELVERLSDEGAPSGLIAIAPHGGDIEPGTHAQAEHVATRLGTQVASCWRCKGFRKHGGAFERWHITSTDINEASFPLLGSVMSRGFTYAVSFHGFSQPVILIGGSAAADLKEELRCEINKVAADACIEVRVARPEEAYGGDSERNIGNRLAEAGAGGVQIEQARAARDDPVLAIAIAEAVAGVYAKRLGVTLRTRRTGWRAMVERWWEAARRLVRRS
jgi:phage replication-related protein YjqB (UPF0714/DUF867 family)